MVGEGGGGADPADPPDPPYPPDLSTGLSFFFFAFCNTIWAAILSFLQTEY